MFIVTRQSRKGKQVDEEIQTAIAMLQDSIENKTESETFKSLFGEEKPGRVRCYGKTMTPSIQKKYEDFFAIKKQHEAEITTVHRKMDGLSLLVRNLLKVQNPNLNEEEISNMMNTALGNENSATPRSSASTYVPPREKSIMGSMKIFTENEKDEKKETKKKNID
ncbi:hypothetical protein OROGR_017974 [Orobanche gracilis]